jgi:hypothetical protein
LRNRDGDAVASALDQIAAVPATPTLRREQIKLVHDGCRGETAGAAPTLFDLHQLRGAVRSHIPTQQQNG